MALRNYNGTLCLVSHDITFVRNLATTIFAMSPHKVTRYFGNYDYYREKLAQEALAANSPQATAKQTSNSQQPAKGRKDRKREEARIRESFSAERRKWEKRVEDDEALIAKKEAELSDIFNQLTANNPNTDYATLNKRVPVLQREIEEATSLWEKASYCLEDVKKRIDAKLAELDS